MRGVPGNEERVVVMISEGILVLSDADKLNRIRYIKANLDCGEGEKGRE